MTPDQGRALAKEHGLDLVEVAPDARPPVCKLMDYGKFRYEQSKRKASSQSSKTSLKTIRLRPKTDDHDLDTKRRRAEKFLQKGDTVRLEMRMRGRERAYPRRWIEVMAEFIDQFDEELEIVSRPHAEGRNISATLQPAGS
jgi:translation initiation factor IF-3